MRSQSTEIRRKFGITHNSFFLLPSTRSGERDKLSEDYDKVSTANKHIQAELAKYSQLNETLEEENRLLKEALGLEADEDPENEWLVVSADLICD